MRGEFHKNQFKEEIFLLEGVKTHEKSSSPIQGGTDSNASWKSQVQGRLSLATDCSVRKIQHLESKSAVGQTLSQRKVRAERRNNRKNPS